MPKESVLLLELMKKRKQLPESRMIKELGFSPDMLNVALEDLRRRHEIDRLVVGAGESKDHVWIRPMHAKSMND